MAVLLLLFATRLCCFSLLTGLRAPVGWATGLRVVTSRVFIPSCNSTGAASTKQTVQRGSGNCESGTVVSIRWRQQERDTPKKAVSTVCIQYTEYFIRSLKFPPHFSSTQNASSSGSSTKSASSDTGSGKVDRNSRFRISKRQRRRRRRKRSQSFSFVPQR